MRALLAPHDTTGLADLAKGLTSLGWELMATEETAAVLKASGINVASSGLVSIEDIDLLAANLGDFAGEPEDIELAAAALLRAGARDFESTVVLCHPGDYEEALAALQQGGVSPERRRALAAAAFQHVALYDSVVARTLRGDETALPNELTIALKKRADLELRYGENPHQAAALYLEAGAKQQGVSGFKQHHGIPISFNNVLDADAAWRTAIDFADPTVVVVKHLNPCGLASHDDLKLAYERALSGDPISAFGGIVACNRPIDAALAATMRASVSPSSGQRMRYDVIVAPGYSEEALAELGKWRDVRILEVSPGDAFTYDLRRVGGGFLLQEPDRKPDESLELKPASRREPTEEEMADLRFAWRVCKHVKSNAIVLVKDRTLLGMGAGQPNRVTSVRLAVERAGERARGSVLASDAFFPFFDGMAVAAAAGVTAAVEPGGSVRDPEVVAIADAAGMALVFSGERHFRH